MHHLADLCFLCLVRSKNIKSVLAQDEDGVVVEEKLECILSELVHFKPEIPKSICADCLKGLNYVYRFKQRCLQNLVSLSEYIEKIIAQGETSIHYLSTLENEKDEESTSENKNALDKVEQSEDKDEALDDSDPQLLCETQMQESNGEVEIVVKVEPDDIHDDGEVKFDFPAENESKEPTQTSSECTSTSTNGEEAVKNERLKKRYKCNECQKVFRDHCYLEKHSRIHTGERPFECKTCGKTFGTANNLERHSRVHTGERPFECPTCHKTFTQQHHLNTHKLSHTGEKPYSCDVCQKSFSDVSSLSKHKRIHNDLRPYKCTLCDKTFKLSGHLNKHMFTHANDKASSELQDHLLATLKSFDSSASTSSVCETPKQDSVDDDEEIEDEDEDKFKVEDNDTEMYEPSDEEITDNAQETSAMKNESDSEYITKWVKRKRHECSFCNKVFPDRSNLEIHRRIHTGERPYECTICQKTFIRTTDLKSHHRTHTGERPYACEVCHKTFSQRGNLRKHRRIHQPNHNAIPKQYPCSVCGKIFTKSNYLNIHMRTHTGERPFQCDICDYKCIRGDLLKQHLMTHSDVKPFSCEHCSYKCTRADHLKVHMRTHTGEKPYICKFCNQGFTVSCSMYNHIRIHHSNTNI